MATFAFDRIAFYSVLISVLGSAAPVDASSYTEPHYSVTDLTDFKGVYDWNKYPVDYIQNPKIVFGWIGTESAWYYQDDSGRLYRDIPVASNKYGSISYEIGRYGPPVYHAYVGPDFQHTYDWVGTGHSSPVADFNIHGIAVGTFSDSPADAMSSFGFLNKEISSDLGIHLTNAFSIDDDGRILAWGMIGDKTHEYLLTPDGLPLPTPAPEPSSLLMFVLGSLVAGRRIATGIKQR